MAANLHALQCFQAQQFQALLEGTPRQGCQTQAALFLRFVVGCQDRAVLVEAGEQTGHFVQISTQGVRGAFFGNVVQHFTELRQFGSQFLLLRCGKYDLTFNFLEVLAQFAEDARDTGVGIQQVGCGIAFKVQHQIEVEAVVAGAVFGQVSVFHSADADHFGNGAQFVFRQFRVFLFDQGVGALFGFGEQVDQLYRAAIAGL